MKYGDFCLDVESHFAAIQKMLNELKTTYSEKDIDMNAFESTKESAISDCIMFEHKLKNTFGKFLED